MTTDLRARTWAGAAGGTLATGLGLVVGGRLLLHERGGLLAAVAALAFAACVCAALGAVSSLLLTFMRARVLASFVMGTVGAMVLRAAWSRPSLAGFATKAAAIAAIASFVWLLVAALTGTGTRKLRGWALAAIGAVLVFAAHHPLIRLETGLRIGLAMFAVTSFAGASFALVSRWPESRALDASFVLSLVAFIGIVRNADARLALGTHTLLGRDVLSALGPVRWWSSAMPLATAPATSATVVTSDLPLVRSRPVVLLTIDALRADAISPTATPNLQRFFDDAITFERAYTPYPSTMVAVPSLLTGRVAWGPTQRWHELLASRPALGAMVRSTRSSVYLAPPVLARTADDDLVRLSPAELGFDRGEAGKWSAEERAALVRTALERDAPALVWAHFPEPHAPYDAHTGFDGGTSERGRYDAEVAYVDHALGPLLDWLATRDVIVWVTADHGEAFGEHGQSFHASSVYDEQIRVPLAVRIPGLAKRRVTGTVSLLDVVPTTLGLLGLPIPASLEGTDLRPRLLGLGSGPASEGRAFALFDERVAMIVGHDKLVCDVPLDACSLFDLQADPQERHDLGATPRASAVAAELVHFMAPDAPSDATVVRAVAMREMRELVLRAPQRAALLLSSSSAEVRRAAARALAVEPTIGELDVETLRRVANDDADAETRAWAAIVLARRGDGKALETVSASSSSELAAWLSVARHSTGAKVDHSSLVAAIHLPNTTLHAWLLASVRRHQDHDLAPALVPFLASDDLAESTADALVGLAPRIAAAELPAAIAKRPLGDVRQSLVRIAGGLGDLPTELRAPLVAALRGALGADLASSAEAAIALARIGEPLPASVSIARRTQNKLEFTLERVDVDGCYFMASLASPGADDAVVVVRAAGKVVARASATGRRVVEAWVPASMLHEGKNVFDFEGATEIVGAALLPAKGVTASAK